MWIARNKAELRAALRALRTGGASLALVPTMGALHAGHLALLAAGRGAADRVAASIFVNPLQFAASEDLDRYPRDEADDLAQLRNAGCDLAWLPTPAVMYPPGHATTIEVAGPSADWEGTQRPGHFRGVATVCCKLFTQTGADVAVFGEKDWQQLQVVRRLVDDLDLPTRILACPTVREVDGLAMSSRNRYLSAEERERAALLPQVLRGAAAALAAGGAAAAALDAARGTLVRAGFGVEYLALVEGETLHEIGRPEPGARLIAAARLGAVRLLDNVEVG